MGYVQIIKEGTDILKEAWYSKTLIKTKVICIKRYENQIKENQTTEFKRIYVT